MEDLEKYINDIEGLFSKLFKGDFWNAIKQVGCLSSNYKVKTLKQRFPELINKMRKVSGVDVALTDENVTEFWKRLTHLQYALSQHIDKNSCRKPYRDTKLPMLNQYMSELMVLLNQAGFGVKKTGKGGLLGSPYEWLITTNYNQSDILAERFTNMTIPTFKSYIWEYKGNGGTYGTIGSGGSSSGSGAGMPSGGISNGQNEPIIYPTIKKANVNKWLMYGLGGWIGYEYFIKKNKEFKKMFKIK